MKNYLCILLVFYQNQQISILGNFGIYLDFEFSTIY